MLSVSNPPSNLLLEGSVFVDEFLGLLQVVGQLVRGSSRLRLDQPGEEGVQVLEDGESNTIYISSILLFSTL